MGRRSFVPLREWKAGEGFLELERAFRVMTRKEEDVLLRRATREALDRLWRKKGVMRSSNPVKRRKVEYK